MNITNLIIIDASGSMSDKEAQVKSGLKELFADIKREAKSENKYTTIVIDFSNHNDVRTIIHTDILDSLTDSVADTYSTRGMTALYDAIGIGFNLVPSKQDGVFVNIITDGFENSSREYNASSIKALIEKKKEQKWGIAFMGTTEGAILDAVNNLGVSVGNTMTFTNTTSGISTAMNKMSNMRSVYTSYTTSGEFATNSSSLNNLVAESE